MLRDSNFPNVMVECPTCEGDGTQTFHNSENGDTRQGECLTCSGKGEVASAEEWAMHDSEDLPKSLGEYAGLQAIADYAEFAESYDHIDESDLLAIYGDIDNPVEAMDDRFVGIYDAFKDYADEVADELISSADGKAQDSILARYFDYDAWARDLAYDMQTVDCPSGVAVFHG